MAFPNLERWFKNGKGMKEDVSDREECEDMPEHALGEGKTSEEKRERVEH